MSEWDDTKLFYFGCIGDTGHRLWSSPYRAGSNFDAIPWGINVDAALCPQGPQQQGVARLHHMSDWTALAFWDRSVDSRPGSNSVFVADDHLTFDEMVEIAKERFPMVWHRFEFEVKPAAMAAYPPLSHRGEAMSETDE